jgi:hypothetical protein
VLEAGDRSVPSLDDLMQEQEAMPHRQIIVLRPLDLQAYLQAIYPDYYPFLMELSDTMQVTYRAPPGGGC